MKTLDSPVPPGLLLFIFAAALLGGCHREAEPSAQSSAQPPLEIKVARPFQGEIIRSISLPGEIKPYQSATLYAKVSGYLKNITVDKGDEVKEGTLLADIEVPELLADQAKYKAEVEVAHLDYKRLTEAQQKAPDLVVPLSVDTARSKSEVAKANLDRAETLLQFTKITAPFSGIVTRRFVDRGAFIPAATSGSTPQNSALLTLMDFSTVRVQVAVPEVEASLIAAGQPVRITAEGLPGPPVQAQVTRFSYALDDASKTMLVEVEVPNPKRLLRPGMYATVKVGVERKEDAFLIPLEALLMEKANASVFVPVDNKAKKTPVKIGFNDGTNVEILSGLKPDQSVILLGKAPLANDQPVRVIAPN